MTGKIHLIPHLGTQALRHNFDVELVAVVLNHMINIDPQLKGSIDALLPAIMRVLNDKALNINKWGSQLVG